MSQSNTSSRKRKSNPRFDPSLRRSARIPLTLIDASTAANRARDLRVLAAALHPWRPCHAQTIQRYATQIENGYTSAQAIALMTDMPGLNDYAERAFSDPSFTSSAAAEVTFTERSIGSLPPF